MMKINVIKRFNDYNDPTGTALLIAITEGIERDHAIQDTVMCDSDGNLDVVFSVNGIELPFDVVMNRFSKSFYDAVRRDAHNLLNKKAQKLTCVLQNIETYIANNIKDLLPKEDWDWVMEKDDDD